MDHHVSQDIPNQNGSTEAEPKNAHADTSDTKPRDATSSPLDSLRAAVRTVKAGIEERPYVALAVVGGVAFGFGTLMGSRVGRMLAGLCASYVVKEIATGPIGKRISSAALDGLLGRSTAGASTTH